MNKNNYLLLVLVVFILAGAAIGLLQRKKIRASSPALAVSVEKGNSVQKSISKNMELLEKQLKACESKFNKLNQKMSCSIAFLKTLKPTFDEQKLYDEYRALNSGLYRAQKVKYNLEKESRCLHDKDAQILFNFPSLLCSKNIPFSQQETKMIRNLKVADDNLHMCWKLMHAYCVRLFSQVDKALDCAPVEPELRSLLNSAVQCSQLSNIDTWKQLGLGSYLRKFCIDNELKNFKIVDLYVKGFKEGVSHVHDKHLAFEKLQHKLDDQLLLENMITAEVKVLDTTLSILNEAEEMLFTKKYVSNNEMCGIASESVDSFEAADANGGLGDHSVMISDNSINKNANSVNGAGMNIREHFKSMIEGVNKFLNGVVEGANGNVCKDANGVVEGENVNVCKDANGVGGACWELDFGEDCTGSLAESADKATGRVIRRTNKNDVKKLK